MSQEPIFAALIGVVSLPGEDIFDGDPGAFANFCAKAPDVESFQRMAESGFATMRLRVVDVENVVIVDVDLEQSPEARELHTRVVDGAPWACGTFHIYPQSAAAPPRQPSRKIGSGDGLHGRVQITGLQKQRACDKGRRE
jgi:hypothetical protein